MDENPYRAPEHVSDPSPSPTTVIPVRRTAARGAIWGAASFGVVSVLSLWWLTSDEDFPGGDPLAQLVMVLRGMAFGAIFGAIVGALIQWIVNWVYRQGKGPTEFSD